MVKACIWLSGFLCLVNAAFAQESYYTPPAIAQTHITQTNTLTQSFAQMGLQSLASIAAQGDAHAQFYLAKRLESGAQKDTKTAAYWYEASAKQGSAPALLNLGLLYLKGDGVPADQARARGYLEQAAVMGDNRASYALAMLEEKQSRFVDAYKWYDVSTRQAMLDPKVKDRAAKKISALALNLSSSDVQTAKTRANEWYAID